MERIIFYQFGGSGMGGPELDERLSYYITEYDVSLFVAKYAGPKHEYFNDVYKLNKAGHVCIGKMGLLPSSFINCGSPLNWGFKVEPFKGKVFTFDMFENGPYKFNIILGYYGGKK